MTGAELAWHHIVTATLLTLAQVAGMPAVAQDLADAMTALHREHARMAEVQSAIENGTLAENCKISVES